MLKLRDITVGYGGKTAIDGLSADFEPGNVYAVLGKNGCGKSTLLKACADILTPKSGEILLNGKNLREFNPLQRARTISYLSQHRNTPNISVERLVMHGRHPHMSNLKQASDTDRQKIDEVMRLMSVDGFKHEPLGALSGGERQRVYIAMLLAQDTPVMLLDEPTTYMDIARQLSFLEYMRELKRGGKLIIAVLHDITHALDISDKILLMDDGKIIKSGAPDEILNSGALESVFGIKVEAHSQDGHVSYCIRL